MIRGRADRRRRAREQSLNLCVGFACQNDCAFCCDGGFGKLLERPDLAPLVRVLEANRRLAAVELTRHEPTLSPDLPALARRARELGYRTVSVVTNGRRLGRGGLAEELVDAGVNRFQISIHGHSAAVHDAVTRRRGSFDQVVAGIQAVARLRRERDVGLVLHTTVNGLNVAHLPRIVPFLLAFEPDHVGLNCVFLSGRAVANIDQVAVRFSTIVEVLRGCLPEDAELPVSVAELPPCAALGRLPRRYLGLREEFHLAEQSAAEDLAAATARPLGRDMSFGPRCGGCPARDICDGVATAYIERFGTGELRPPRPEDLEPAMPRREREARALLGDAGGRWTITGLQVREERVTARLQPRREPWDLVVELTPRDETRGCFARTERHNLCLVGARKLSRVQLALADAVVEQVRRAEERRDPAS